METAAEAVKHHGSSKGAGDPRRKELQANRKCLSGQQGADVVGVSPSQCFDQGADDGDARSDFSSASVPPEVPARARRSSVAQGSMFGSRVRIRCIGATGLPGVSSAFFGGGANPYAVLYLSDTRKKQQSPLRRTRCIAGTLNPKWREDFCFAVSAGSASTLILHIEVWHSCNGDQDEFLGYAETSLGEQLTRDSRELQLKAHEKYGGEGKAKGTVKVEIGFESALHNVSVAFNPKHSFLVKAWSSPQALRSVRVLMLGSAGFLMFVAAQARWLCSGASLHGCVPHIVPGTQTCATFASFAAFVATLVNFAGSVGMLGPRWSGEPLGIYHVLDPVEFGEDDRDEEDTSVRMKVQSLGMLQWNISMATNLLPKVSCIAVRFATFLAYVCAVSLGILGASLAWLEEDTSELLGEAVYLDLVAVAFLVSASFTSFREQRLLVNAEGARWTDFDEEMPKQASGMPNLFFGAFGGKLHKGRSDMAIEEWARNAQNKLQQTTARFKQDADALTQPLLDARSRLQSQLEKDAGTLRQHLSMSIDGLLSGHPARQDSIVSTTQANSSAVRFGRPASIEGASDSALQQSSTDDLDHPPASPEGGPPEERPAPHCVSLYCCGL